MTQQILILCPLEIERRAAVRRVGAACEVQRIGPGAGNVTRAMVTINLLDYSLVVLFGVAGGLTQTDRAPAIAEVVDRESGERWKSPQLCLVGRAGIDAIPIAGSRTAVSAVVPPSTTGETPVPLINQAQLVSDVGTGVTVVGVDEPVCTPNAKRDLRARFGASLVDCESHEFARRCEAIGVRWAIVRGVSDGPDDTLPDQSASWITRDGRTRLVGVAKSLARNPFIIRSLLKLGRQTNEALEAACDRLEQVVAQDAQRGQR